MGGRGAIRLEELTRSYGRTRALDSIDLEVRAGELLTLVGPSGSGKSTVLRLIAGLDRPDGGRVLVDGQDVARVPPHRRAVAMVFQDYALYPHLTVLGNLTFGLRVRRVPRAEADRRAREAADRLGIADLLDRHPDEMSGGQRQRVALARALLREPSVYLLDEPLASLDAPLRFATRADLLALHRDLGTTTIHVTHDQAEAMTLGDRVAVLDRGRVRQVGPPQQVYDEPADTFVAAFLGSPPMNLVPGGGLLGGAAGLTLGVRPENLALDPDGPIEATVDAVEALGSEAVLLTRCADGTRLTVRTGPRSGVRAGDRVRLRPDPDRIHRFDADTGRRR
ncbi:carbohydrate ABC transporter ATP-binding protein, CUT1 family [Micromonospora echinaurantiaca]|uniref:Carbohydrate ABC transporter ATP-binding protein, CUT1 family n=1 Tax=Micromonospora echinaurantiaca TaxID=47857 RepID=A0A1C5IAQ4_9ACTN|nr:ABC transporter ATP-binding protein [Micromonospora echinaurantiaca]SCG55225.1 carbohydrate ABC transporter ATP-binding protein, CUT1 family [Micromonospora echinaurantiaca]